MIIGLAFQLVRLQTPPPPPPTPSPLPPPPSLPPPSRSAIAAVTELLTDHCARPEQNALHIFPF